MKKMCLGLLASAVVISPMTLSACSASSDIQPGSWTCDKLVQPVIEMSEERDVQILEITNVEQDFSSTSKIECSGRAEWSEGYGSIDFGAYVSDGDQIILEYQRN